MRISKISRYIIFLTIIAALLFFIINAIFFRAEADLCNVINKNQSLQSGILDIQSFSDGYLIVDRENDIHFLRNWKTVRSLYCKRKVLSLVADSKNDRIILSEDSGEIKTFNPNLDIKSSFVAHGVISGLVSFSNGNFAICNGKSNYGPDYKIKFFSKQNEKFAEVPTGFCTRLLTADGNYSAYATVNSRVALMNPMGEIVWNKILWYRPTAIKIDSIKKVIVVTDIKGNLTLLDWGGNILWKRYLSDFPLSRVFISQVESVIICSDTGGRVFILDLDGKKIFCEPEAVHKTAPVAFVSGKNALFLATYDGGIHKINMALAKKFGWAQNLKFWRDLINCFFVVFIIMGIIGSNQKWRQKIQKIFKRVYESRYAYFLLMPTFLLLLLFKYYPAITAFSYSFTNFSLNHAEEFVGLDNFHQMLSDRYVWIGMRNMLIFLIAGIVKTMTMPLLAAELVFWLSSERFKQIFRTAFVFPAVIPGVVFVLLWVRIYDPYNGLLNHILRGIGLESYAHAWLAEEGYALWAIIFAGFPWISVFAFLIFLGGLINISKDLYEASDLDGVNLFTRFLYIDLPLLKSQIRLLIIFCVIASVQDFTNVLIFTNGGPGISTYVPALQMFKQISEGSNLGYAASIGLVLFMIVIFLSILNNKIFKIEE